MPGGRIDGGLEIEPEHGMAEEECERPLVLLVSARGPEREVRLPVPERERRAERRPRPAPRGERARQALRQPEHLRPRPEGKAELGNEGRAVEPAAARRGRDEVAVAIDDVDVAGVATRRLADPGRGDGGRVRRRR
jgi:hypothetical protein